MGTMWRIQIDPKFTVGEVTLLINRLEAQAECQVDLYVDGTEAYLTPIKPSRPVDLGWAFLIESDYAPQPEERRCLCGHSRPGHLAAMYYGPCGVFGCECMAFLPAAVPVPRT